MATLGRIFHPPTGSYFLFGPRGTGKSTYLRQTYPSALWLDLLDAETQRRYLAKPERLRELVQGNPDKNVVVVDEIQKAPALLDTIHQLIEAQPNLTFVLTGSSARKLRRGAVNLLAGRLLELSMHPFMACEMAEEFQLDQALRIGLVPLIIGSDDTNARLKAYVSLYLREELQAEGMVRQVGNFARFLESIAFSHGGVLNVSEVARECETSRKTVEGYVEILEDLLLAFRVPIFSKRAERQLIKHEKFYYFDTGVFRSVRPKGPLDRPEEIDGAALEGLVAQHLRAWCAYRKRDDRLYYWRTKAGNEVDFVVYGEDTFVAIEVKRAAKITGKDLVSLKSFREDYPEAKTALFYLGKDKVNIDGILCVPCEAFLRWLSPDAAISF